MKSEKEIKFEEMGGREAISRITSVFYDRIYDDPWLSQFFEGIPRDHIESQQIDFMQAALGGHNQYGGKTPPSAHKHINITEDVFVARQKFLIEAFEEVNANEEMVRMWMKIEDTFKRKIVKESIDDCEMRYSTEGIRDFPNPNA